MHIRAMHPDDAEAIHAIHTACLTESLRADYSQEQILAWMTGRTPDGYRRSSLGGEHFLVASENDETLGYASWAKDELLSLFILPAHQKRGMGTALLEACLSDAQSNGSIISRLRSTPSAEPFYTRHGFVRRGVGTDIKNGVGLDHVIMTTSL